MELLAHVPVPIGTPYELSTEEAADVFEVVDEGDWDDMRQRNENGFYEAIATVYCEVVQDEAKGKDVGEASRSFLRGVRSALAEHDLTDVAGDASLNLTQRVGPTAKALRKCIAGHLDTHFDALFDSSRATQENRDALFHMYNTAWSGWREKLRHASGRDAPDEIPDAFQTGKDRLRNTAMMYIEQRLKRADQRLEVSALEANIAAHLFRTFLYLYKGSREQAELQGIYGPDADTFERSSTLLRIAILSDGAGTYYLHYDKTVVHSHSNDEVQPVHDGDAPLNAQQAFEKRVRIVGGSSPLREAERRSEFAEGSGNAFSETTDLMQRSAKFLRPARTDTAEYRNWLEARRRAYNEEDAERRQRRVEWREHWREEAGGEQKRSRVRNRTVNGEEIWGGYPRSRTVGTPLKPPKPWKWADLQVPGREAELEKAQKKLVEYGKMDDERRDRRRRNLPSWMDSWWGWQHFSENPAWQEPQEKARREKELKEAQDRVAKWVWYDTYGDTPLYKDAQNQVQAAGLPKYKRVVLERGDGELEGLVNRRMIVKRWMLGHMRRPVLADGSTPPNHRQLRCQAAQNFVNNYPILEHPNLEYALSFCDSAQQKALEDEYVDFMAAERRLLMNVLRKVPRGDADDDAHRNMLEQAYRADSASFARCNPNVVPLAPRGGAAATTDAASANKDSAKLPDVLVPSFFAREFTGEKKSYTLGAPNLPLPRWATGKGFNNGGGAHYIPQKAKALVTQMKGYNERQARGKAVRAAAAQKKKLKRNTGCEELLENEDGNLHKLGRIKDGRMPMPTQIKDGTRRLVRMPNKTKEPNLYNAALVRLLEFFDELHPWEVKNMFNNANYDWECLENELDEEAQNRLDELKALEEEELTEAQELELRTLEDQPPQPWRYSFWADPLISRPTGTSNVSWRNRLNATKRSSKFVTGGVSTIVEVLIRRLLEYGREPGHSDAFHQDNQAWAERADTIQQADGGGMIKAGTLANAFYTSLLTAFPESRESGGGREINSIMEFIRWFHLHVWRPWNDVVEGKKGKRAFKSVLSQLACIPDINTVPVLKKEYTKDRKPVWKDWEDHAYEATLFEDVSYYMDRLWEAVTFTKMALDFAVVDRDSPLRQTDELRKVLDAWLAMTKPEPWDAAADAEDELVQAPGDADADDDAGVDG